jgi:hypothetical protein
MNPHVPDPGGMGKGWPVHHATLKRRCVNVLPMNMPRTHSGSIPAVPGPRFTDGNLPHETAFRAFRCIYTNQQRANKSECVVLGSNSSSSGTTLPLGEL